MTASRSLLVFLMLCASGCHVQTGIAPSETIIATSSERDFGFVGTWTPVPNPKIGPTEGNYQELQISRESDYTATVRDTNGKSEDEITVDFRTHEISPEHPHAIVEIELENNGTLVYHRLAIAAVRDDNLFLWMIDGQKIGAALFKEGASAVIEHFSFSTTVRCDPKKLLDTITKHANDVTGEVQTFTRKKK